MIETLSSPAAVSFTLTDGVEPQFHRYTTPISKIETANTVWNVLSYGIDASWATKNSLGGFDTGFSGTVSNIKFYYGNGIPDTLTSVRENQQWRSRYDLYFKPPIDGSYQFHWGGSGQVAFVLASAGGVYGSGDTNMKFEDQLYHTSNVLELFSSNSYQISFIFTSLSDRESGAVLLWDVDSASVTPNKVLMSAGVTSPYNNGSNPGKPSFNDILDYSNVNYSENEDGTSLLSFEVPFVDSSNLYNNKGYYYDSSSDSYISLSTSSSLSPLLKKYRMIRYSSGYRNNSNQDELMTKFTGQVRDIKVNYKNKGQDVLKITCLDYSVFTKDDVNISHPNPVDYWQVGYLKDLGGKVNGFKKPRAFDGWQFHKMYEVLLTESFVDSYSFYGKKLYSNYDSAVAVGGFNVETLNGNIDSWLSSNIKYGLEPVGKSDSNNKVDDKYAYSISSGEFYKDFILKQTKQWYYNWGFNPNGEPYLKRINAPYTFIDSINFNTTASGWTNSNDINAFSGHLLTTSVVNSVCSARATGKKFELLVKTSPSDGNIDGITPSLNVIVENESVRISSADYNAYNSTANFFVDGPDAFTGVNKSLISIANNLPYDEYTISIKNIDSNFNTSIEAILAYDEEYQVPIEIYYTGTSSGRGTIGKLDIEKNLDEQRTDAVVIGKRTGTQFIVDENGNQVAVNPNNPVNTYLQSASRDLSAVYSTSASNYVGRTRTTFIVDPSFINQKQADFVSFNVIKEYGNPKKGASFLLPGTPQIQVGDAIAIKEDTKNGISISDYLWVTSVNEKHDKKYTTNIKTTPIKPVDSFWKLPNLDVQNDFNGDYIKNLVIKNSGHGIGFLQNNVYPGTRGATAEITFVKDFDSTSDGITSPGYMKIGNELMLYDSADVSAGNGAGGRRFIRLKGITRGIGLSTVDQNSWHHIEDQVILGYNAYSLSQAQPSISFDLLTDANVEVTIRNSSYQIFVANESNVDISELKVDSLTDINGDLEDFNYQKFSRGHYEFVWGGFDRRGQYNNTVKNTDEGTLFPSQFYARENYRLLSSFGHRVSTGFGFFNAVSTGFGLFLSQINVIPSESDSQVFTYSSDKNGSHLLNQLTIDAGKDYSGMIKTILSDPGKIDLQFKVEDMFVTKPSADNQDIQGDFSYYSHERPNRETGLWNSTTDPNLYTATNYPHSSGAALGWATTLPSFILNRSNQNEVGAAEGLRFQITSIDEGINTDFSRVYLPTTRFHIVQLGIYQVSKTGGGNVLVVPSPIITTGKLDEIGDNFISTKDSDVYFINIKKFLSKKDISFIPSDWENDFKARADGPNAPMYITNYIVFEHTTVDLSGRRPQQRRQFTINKKPNTLLTFIEKKDIVDYWYVPEVYLDTLGTDLAPYNFGTSDATNIGFYEFLAKKPKLTWVHQWNDGVNPNKRNMIFNFERNIRDEMKQNWSSIKWDEPAGTKNLQNIAASGLYTFRFNVFSEQFPYNRNCYITWLDEDVVRETLMFEMNNIRGGTRSHGEPGGILYERIHEALKSHNVFIPDLFAVFRRSDFS